MIDRATLIYYLEYDPITGWFTNRMSRGRAKVGERAGSDSGHGYRKIVIEGQKLYEHHLAWLYVYDEWPEEIDHVDGDGSHNPIANLRECNRSQNCHNSKRDVGESGLRGAYLDKRNLQWYSKIQLGDQQKFLGNFGSEEEAHEAYLRAADMYHGDFALHNRPEPTQPLRRL